MRSRHRRHVCPRRQRLFQNPRLRLGRPAPAQQGRTLFKPVRYRLDDYKCFKSGLGCRLQSNLPRESLRECRPLHRSAKHGAALALTKKPALGQIAIISSGLHLWANNAWHRSWTGQQRQTMRTPAIALPASIRAARTGSIETHSMTRSKTSNWRQTLCVSSHLCISRDITGFSPRTEQSACEV